MDQLTCVDDFEKLAKTKLDPAASRFYYDGAGNEITLRRNRTGFQQYMIKPKNMLNSVEKIDLTTELLNGTVKLEMPIGISPTAFHKLADPEGEIATAKACSKTGGVMTLSTWTTTRLAEVAKEFESKENLWMNTYIFTDREKTWEFIKLAEQAGCGALVVSCDIQILSDRRYSREPAIMSRVCKLLEHSWCPYVPKDRLDEYAAADPSATWEDFEKVTQMTKLPVVAKGITTAHDARKAVEHGAKAIWVSNHGGRQLDSIPSTIEVLPEVVGEVGGEVDVYLHSGVRTGNDILKALCLGAKAVFLGRPILSGLACNGEDGAKRVLEILRDELRTTTTLAGCADVKKLDSSYLWKSSTSKI